MSSFTKDEFDALYATDDVEMLQSALTRLDEEIPRVQGMYDNAVKDGEKTRDYRLSVGILRGTKAGLIDHGLSAGVGLVPLRELKREIKNYLESLLEVQPEVEKVTYGEPPVPSPVEAEAEQDAIEESMNRAAEKKNTVLQELILVDKHLTKFEERPDVAIHELIADEHDLQDKILREALIDDFTESLANMLKAFFGVN